MGSIGWVAIGADGAIACLIICRWTRCHRRSPHSIFTSGSWRDCCTAVESVPQAALTKRSETTLLDHLVGTREQHGWDREAVGRRLAPENAVHIRPRAAVGIDRIRSVAEQAAK